MLPSAKQVSTYQWTKQSKTKKSDSNVRWGQIRKKKQDKTAEDKAKTNETTETNPQTNQKSPVYKKTSTSHSQEHVSLSLPLPTRAYRESIAATQHWGLGLSSWFVLPNAKISQNQWHAHISSHIYDAKHVPRPQQQSSTRGNKKATERFPSLAIEIQSASIIS